MEKNSKITGNRGILNIDDTIDIRDYLRIIIKHRWVIITIFSLVFMAGLLYGLTATPIYEATAGIIIDKEENDPGGSLQMGAFTDTTGIEYYQTMYKILDSRSVADKVIQRLKLAENMHFYTRAVRKDTDNASAQANHKDALIRVFLANLKIVPLKNSHYVNINYQSKDPALAAAIANAIVEAYREHAFAMKLDSIKNSSQWLNDNMAQERKKVEDAERALQNFREKNNIVMSFSSTTEKAMETITAEKLAQLNGKVVEAEIARGEVEIRYKQAVAAAGNPDMVDALPEVLNNPLIADIMKQEVGLVQRKSELSKKYGAQHPQMLALQSEMKSLQAKKEQEVQRIIDGLNNTWQVALAKEKSLKEALLAQKGEAFNLNKNAIEYTGLYCEAEGAKTMYALLLKRFKETSVTENLKIGNIRVVDKADTPLMPIKPQKMRTMLLAAIFGLAAALGMTFLLEYLDDAINTPEDIKQQLRIPFLGIIPLRQQKGPADAAPTPPALEAFSSPRSPTTEAYRGIRTNIFYSLPEAEPQVILITSTLSREGKTTCAANIAVTMAQFGYRVALLDCDFHWPQMRKLFAIAQECGMTNLLVGNKKIEDVVCATDVPNLHVIPSGPIPPNPSEILGSKKMQALIEELKQKYDKIIIDSPPIALVTDSLMLAHAVDGIVFIVRAGSTPKKIAGDAVEAIKGIGAKVLGAVINALDTHKAGYHYYANYPYHYGYYSYGDEANKRKPQGLRKKLLAISHKAKKIFLR